MAYDSKRYRMLAFARSALSGSKIVSYGPGDRRG